MWKKLVNRFRRKVERPDPFHNLREELLSIQGEMEKPADSGPDSKTDSRKDSVLDSRMGSEQDAKLASIKKGLHQLPPEQLLALAKEIWNDLGATGKAVLYQALKDKGKINSLLTDLSGTNKPKTTSAAEMLGQFQVMEALPKLVEMLSSSDLGVVMAAAAALKNYPSHHTLPLLLETLDEPRRWPPARVAEVIVSYGPGVAPVLVNAFREQKGDVRILLMEILGQLRSQEGVPAIRAALSAEEPSLRQKGAWAAGQLGGDLASGYPVVKQLQALLQDPVPGVRAQALEALWQRDAGKALPLVQAALLDEDRLVRGRAAGILSDRQDLPRELWSILGKKELSLQDRQALEAWLSEAAAAARKKV